MLEKNYMSFYNLTEIIYIFINHGDTEFLLR